MTRRQPVEDPRARRIRSWVLDVTVVVIVGLFAAPYLVGGAPSPRWLSALGVAGLVLPLLVRRLWPVPAFAVITLCAIGFGIWDTRPDIVEPLTEREREVFLLMARGRSNRETAADLYVSEHTVKIHVGRVLAKLDLRDRIHAVVLAYESGLITPGQD